MDTKSLLSGAFGEARRVLGQFVESPESVARVGSLVEAIVAAYLGGRKVLICGNGGSLCDASHFAEELTGRFRKDRKPLAAIACADAGHITCVANDYGFEEVFARWVRALGVSGDVLIVLSTSGNSENCVRACTAGQELGLKTCAMLGKGGGRMRGMCDLEIVVPGETSDRIQEIHMLVLHAVVEGVEGEMAKSK
jgi:D-sedoheptulose 7-phosphate isomerase